MINLNEERILDFLDGRLATPDEEELLHTLAVSPERRQVLRAHIRLRELTNTLASQERFAVPENVTSQLFTRLEQAGFTPAPNPESMLAPVSESISMPVAGAAAGAGLGVFATALSSGWRFGMMGLLAASVMSFVLGAGAYYVFGSSLGLRTHSQEIAALHHPAQHNAMAHNARPVAANSDIAQAAPVSENTSNAVAERPVDNFSAKNQAGNSTIIAASLPIGPMRLIGPMKPAGNLQDHSSEPTAVSSDLASNDNSPAIGYTAPKQMPFTLAKDNMRYLNGPATIWPNAVPAPYAVDRGTISVRTGFGQPISGTDAPLSQLYEFRIGWTMWNYVIWRASMAEMNAFERSAQRTPVVNGTGYEVTTPESNTPTTSTLMGLEAGVTLDPIGFPIDALVGAMASGLGSTVYWRASLMAHFEPWKLLEISAGLEGIWYNHDLTNAISQQANLYGQGSTPVSTTKALSSEVSGLVGPAIEVGWHF